jgi:hypothetical protein
MRLLTTESLQIKVVNSVFVNRLAASEDCVTGHATSTGEVIGCRFFKYDDTDLIPWSTPTLMQFCDCLCANLAAENGGIVTTVST